MIESILPTLPQLARQGVETALNSVWQGALVVLVVWASVRLVPRVNAATRHAVWYATLLGLAVLPVLSGRFVTNPQPWVSPVEGTGVTLIENPAPTPVPESALKTYAPEIQSSKPPQPVEPRLVAAAESPAFGVARSEPHPSGSWGPIRVRSGPWIVVLAAIFVLVVATKWGLLLVNLVRIRRIKAQAQPMNAPAGTLWPVWQRESRLGRRVWLGWSDRLAVPAVFGFVHPAILFPYRLRTTLNETQMQQVALHELAHVARFDDWWQVLQRVIEAALFFQPAVHFVSRQIALEREIACDDWVMHKWHRPKDYADCLTRLVEHKSAHALPIPGAVRSRKHIVRRIEMLLNRNRNTRPGTSRAKSALAAAALSLMIVQAGFTRPVVALTSTPTPKPPSSLEAALAPGQIDRAQTPQPVPRSTSATRTTPATSATPATVAVPSTAPTPRPTRMTWAQAEPPTPPQQPAQPRPPSKVPTPPPTPPRTPKPEAETKGRTEEHAHDGNSLTINQDGDEMTWTWSGSHHKVRVDLDGRVVFSGAGTAVEKISADGYFDIEERSGGKSRELEVVPGRDDTLEYYYSENGDPLPYDEVAQRWFQELLPSMMRKTGLGAHERVTTLRSTQGVAGVLREVSLISSDYVKRLYFEELVAGDPLSDEEVRSLFHQVGREMDSDYEKAELLIKYADYTHGQAENRDAYVEAVKGMESDYEIHRVLSAMGTQENISDAYAEAVIRLAMGMDSDYEKAELLLELADYSRDHAPARELYLDAVAQIDSDYDKRRVLEGVLMPRLADETFVNQVLAITQTIDSDYERVELLIRMADSAVAHDRSLTSYLRAVETVDSDFEKRRALSALPWHEGLSDDVCIDLLRVVSTLDSDFEKAEFLSQYGKYFAGSEAARDALDRAVDSIDSDYERQRVEAAIYRHSRKSGSGDDTY